MWASKVGSVIGRASDHVRGSPDSRPLPDVLARGWRARWSGAEEVRISRRGSGYAYATSRIDETLTLINELTGRSELVLTIDPTTGEGELVGLIKEVGHLGVDLCSLMRDHT